MTSSPLPGPQDTQHTSPALETQQVEGPRYIEELWLPFDDSQVRTRVLRRRRQLRSRLVSLVITVVFLAVIAVWQRDQLSGTGYLVLYAVVLGVSLAWFLVYLVRHLLAKRELATIGTGTALRIDRTGVEVRGTNVAWPQVRSLSTTSGGLGRSPLLTLNAVEGPALSVPLDQIAVKPATLDLTARAYSAGRHGVDLSALGA